MNTFQMAKQALLHPYDFFEDIQAKGRWHQAIIMILLTIVARVTSLGLSGFFFQAKEPYQISIWLEALWIVAPWLTWTVSNWGVATIADGEGKYKDLFVSSAFVLTPYVLLSIPISIISNVLTRSELSLYIGMTWFMILWVVFLLLLQVKILHGFEFGKTIWMSVLTVIGMFIIWLIGMLLFGLINQSVFFLLDLIDEISYRM
jgi:hypothetical protein